MTVKVYRSNDASAPALTGQAGSLITLLDACLVNGFGTKTSAGWTKAFSGTNKAAYRMPTTTPATGFYLRVDDTGSTDARDARLIGYETMTGIDAGANPFPTSVQMSGGAYLIKSSSSDSTPRPWILVASPRSFYLFVFANNTVYGSSADNWTNTMFFGDIITRKAVDGYECLLIGSYRGSTSSSSHFAFNQGISATFSPHAAHYMARSYTGIAAGAIQVSKTRNYRHAYQDNLIGRTQANLFPNKITNSIDFATMMICESDTVWRGSMPGFYEPAGGFNSVSAFFELEGQGSLTGKTLLFIPIYAGSDGGSCAIQINGSWY